MSEFKVGDVVKLKSSGPKMTVTNISSDNEVSCIWFDVNERKNGCFPLDTLTKNIEEISKEDTYDEKGVLWKNRAKEFERRYRKLKEKDNK